MHREIDRYSLTLLVCASMIGAGVYTTSGFAIADLGQPWRVMLAWTVGGLIAICGAISYGQLAGRLAENGGEYLYLSRYVHPAAGFVAGWVSFFAGFTGSGAIAALAFEAYAVPSEIRPNWLPPSAIACGLILLATAAHALSTWRGAASQNVVVATKLALIFVFIVIALLSMGSWEGGSWFATGGETTAVGMLDFATSIMWISLSYSGFNAAIYVAGESRRGSHDVAYAMITGTVVVTIIYLLLNGIFVLAPTVSSIAGKEDVAAIAADSIGGPWLSILVRITICLGLATSVSSAIMAGPRVYTKMAEDGYFPRFFISNQPPPTRAIVLQGVAIALVALIAGLPTLLSYLGMTLALSAAATVCTLFLDNGGDGKRMHKSPMRLAAPAIYVVATIVIASLAAWNRPLEGVAAISTMLLGGVVYAITSRSHDRGRVAP